MARPQGTPPILMRMSGLSLDSLAAHEAAADPHPGYQRESERGQPNGYAALDSGGRVPTGQLPAATATSAGLVALDALFGNLGPDLFGTGADGNVTITGNTSLTRDMDYENLTVNVGVTLNTAGFRVRVASTLTWNGTIACNGGNAAGATAGAAGGSAAGSYAPGTSGGAGGTTTGVASSASSNNWGALHAGTNNACRGGAGGVGGPSGAVAGGLGGGATGAAAPAAASGAETQATWDSGYLHGQTVVRLTPSTGGGGGGGSGGNSGGGGGGGGICGVFARRIAGSGGAQQARGGAGGNAAGGTSGGGGGGGGGIVVCRYAELAPGAALPTTSVAGGAGGTKLGTGSTNGNTGQAGYSSVRRVVRVT